MEASLGLWVSSSSHSRLAIEMRGGGSTLPWFHFSEVEHRHAFLPRIRDRRALYTVILPLADDPIHFWRNTHLPDIGLFKGNSYSLQFAKRILSLCRGSEQIALLVLQGVALF